MTETGKSSNGSTAAIVSVVVLVGYFLSIGPVIWMFEHDWISSGMEDMIEIAYAPLSFLYNNVGAVKTFIDFYMELWD